MRRSGLVGLLLLLLWSMVQIPNAAGAAAFTPVWQWRHPSPMGETLTDLTYGNGRWVAVGFSGAVMTSADGTEWTAAPRITAAWLVSVTYVRGQFWAFGHEGLVMTSTDGVTWERIPTNQSADFGEVAASPGRFVAVTRWGELLTSADGSTWSRPRLAPTQQLNRVRFGNGRFVAVGDAGAIFTSVNGEDWESKPSGTKDDLNYVSFAHDRFFVFGYDVTLSSTDGGTWAKTTISSYENRYSVAYGKGSYVSVGNFGGYSLSGNGENWAEGTIHGANSLYAIHYANDRFVAVGEGGTIVTSSDGRTWTVVVPEYPLITGLAYGNGAFVAVGEDGLVLFSRDAEQWKRVRAHTAGDLSAVTFANGLFVAVGEMGRIRTSTDGQLWEEQQSGTFQDLAAIFYHDGQFFAAGDQETLVTSPDAKTWSVVHTGRQSYKLTGLAYGAGKYVAIGHGGALLTSTDGVNWRSGDVGVFEGFFGVAYGAGRFVAVAGAHLDRFMLTSTDGETWKEVRPGIFTGLYGITYTANNFVAIGSLGTVATSVDGLEWTVMPRETSNRLVSALVANGHLIVAGEDGAILSTQRACGTRFSDLSASHPGCLAIDELVSLGIANGYTDGSFRPERGLTRAEFAKLLVLATGKAPEAGAPSPQDAEGHWAARQGYVQAAIAHRLMGGFPDGTFRPDAPVTRAQMVKAVVSAAGVTPDWSRPSYTDVPEYEWYAGVVRAAVENGLIGPLSAVGLWTGQELRGDTPATRAEACMLLYNLLAFTESVNKD